MEPPGLRFHRLPALSQKLSAHGAHEHFAVGERGDPKKPFRVVKITRLEDGKKMLFEPAWVEADGAKQGAF